MKNLKAAAAAAAAAAEEWPLWAELVLPYLPPASLSAMGSTCSSLHRLSLSITTQRISDASRTFENHPIPFLNSSNVARSPPYSYFIYTPTSLLPSSLPLILPQPWPLIGSGSTSKPDKARSGSISVRLLIIRHPRKGWGLHAGERIEKSRFVCEYAGEYLTTEEARRRQREYDETGMAAAMMVVREHLPSRRACLRVNIDSTRVGNVGRFVNHACDGGNLEGVVMREKSGEWMPRVGLFARREIEKGEELCFSYGEGKGRSKPCCCGTPECCGWLPFEDT